MCNIEHRQSYYIYIILNHIDSYWITLNSITYSLLTYIDSYPLEPHKAVAEVSNEETYRRGSVLGSKKSNVNPQMNRKGFGISHEWSVFVSMQVRICWIFIAVVVVVAVVVVAAIVVAMAVVVAMAIVVTIIVAIIVAIVVAIVLVVVVLLEWLKLLRLLSGYCS